MRHRLYHDMFMTILKPGSSYLTIFKFVPPFLFISMIMTEMYTCIHNTHMTIYDIFIENRQWNSTKSNNFNIFFIFSLCRISVPLCLRIWNGYPNVRTRAKLFWFSFQQIWLHRHLRIHIWSFLGQLQTTRRIIWPLGSPSVTSS